LGKDEKQQRKSPIGTIEFDEKSFCRGMFVPIIIHLSLAGLWKCLCPFRYHW